MSKNYVNQGGPAFPYRDEHGSDSGMTLRDWFAGQMTVPLSMHCMDKGTQLTPEVFAKEAYRFADAMLFERTKP